MVDLTDVANTGIAQKHVYLTILLDGVGATEEGSFGGHVSSILCSPSYSQVNWSGGAPGAQLSDTVPGPWSLALNVGQDWENADALCNFLLAHEGEGATIKYRPSAEGTFAIETHVPSLAAPAIGGAVNAFNESTVTLGCDKPTPTFPA